MCKLCIKYEEFRTGLTFNDVRQQLKMEAKKKYEKGQYMFITRATVLGRWKQIKSKMYEDYCNFVNSENNLPDFINKEY